MFRSCSMLDGILNGMHNRQEALLDCLIDPIREAADACDADNQCHCRQTLKPCGVGELTMMVVMHRTKQQLAYNAQDVDRCDHD